MSNQLPPLGADIRLNLEDFNRKMSSALRDSADFDAAIDRMIGSSNKLSNSLNSIEDINIKANLDDSAFGEAERLLSRLDGNVSVKVGVEDAELLDAEQLLNRLDGNVSTRVDVQDAELQDAGQLLDRLDGNVTTRVDVQDAELEDAKRKRDGIDGSVNVTVTADSSDLDDIESQLNKIKQLSNVNMVFTAASMVQGLELPLIGDILEGRAAERIANVRVGLQFEGADEASRELYLNAFGASREEAAIVLAATVQMTRGDSEGIGDLSRTGESFGDIAAGALTLQDAFGEDFNEMLRTADVLVATGMEPSFESAFDTIAFGFQNGLNRSGDFLDSIKEYSTYFEQLGFDSESMLGVFAEGLEQGSFNTDYVGDLYKEIQIRLQAAMSGEGMEFDAFKAMGLDDDVQAFRDGELVGQELINGILQRITSEDIDPQIIFDMFGTKGEDLTLDVVQNLAGESLGDASGTTAGIADALYNNIETALLEAQRAFQDALSQGLETAVQDSGLLNTLTDAAQTFASELRGGASIGEAIEVALELAPGTFGQLESMFGNFILSLSEVFAGLLDILGQGEAAAGLRGYIAEQGAGQLAFDLQQAPDATAVMAATERARGRGVSEDTITESLSTAVSELAGAGKIDQLADLFRSLSTIESDTLSPETVDFLAGRGVDVASLEAGSDAMKEVMNELSLFAAMEGTIARTGAPGERESANRAIEELTALEAAPGTGASVGRMADPILNGLLEQGQQGNWSAYFDAIDISRAIGDSGLVVSLVQTLNNEMSAALADYDFDTAQQIAEGLGTQEALKEVQEATREFQTEGSAAITEFTSSFDPLLNVIGTVGSKIIAENDEAAISYDGMSNAVGRLPSASAAAFGALVGDIGTAITAAQNLAGILATLDFNAAASSAAVLTQVNNQVNNVTNFNGGASAASASAYANTLAIRTGLS